MTIAINKKFFLYFSVIFITAISLWIRISYFQQTVIDIPVRGDAVSYVQYAKNIIQYGTFSKDKKSPPTPDSYWAPGYPTFLAGVIIVGDISGIDSYQLAMYSQVVFGTLIAVLTLLLGRLFLNQYWSLLPSILVSLSPHLISMGGYLLTETLFSFLLLASIYTFSLAFGNKSRLLFSLSGLLFGLSYLVNPVMLFIPIFLAISAGLSYMMKGMKIKNICTNLLAPFLMIFLVIFASWFTRGMVNIPLGQASSSDRLLTNLIIGSHSDFFDFWRNNPRDKNNPATKDGQIINGSFSTFGKLMASRILDDPTHYAKWYLIDKPILLWSWNILFGQGDIYVYPTIISLYQRSRLSLISYSIMKSAHYWLYGCALLGFVFLFRANKHVPYIPIFLYITLIGISAIYVISQSEPRYSIPLRPEMYLCAVFFVYRLFSYTRQIGKSHKLRASECSETFDS